MNQLLSFYLWTTGMQYIINRVVQIKNDNQKSSKSGSLCLCIITCLLRLLL